MKKSNSLTMGRGFDFLKVLINKELLSVTTLSKETDTTYAYASNVVKELEKQKLVRTKKVNRTRQVNLTKKGKEATNYLLNLIKEIEYPEVKK